MMPFISQEFTVNPQIISTYKNLIVECGKDYCQDVFDQAIIDILSLKNDSKISIISGKDFNPVLFGYKNFVPEVRDYIFYYFNDSVHPKFNKRVLQCQHVDPETGHICG
jgi:hypothetical protein